MLDKVAKSLLTPNWVKEEILAVQTWEYELQMYGISSEQAQTWLSVINNAAPQQIYTPNTMFAQAARERVRAMAMRGDGPTWIDRFIRELPEGVYIRTPWGQIYELPYPQSEPQQLPVELQGIVQRFLDDVRPILNTVVDTKAKDRQRSRDDLKAKRREMWRRKVK